MHLYSWLFHIPLDWQRNSIGVSSSPFGSICVGLHDGIAFVSYTDSLEQSALLPFREHLISKLSDIRGGHISININIL